MKVNYLTIASAFGTIDVFAARAHYNLLRHELQEEPELLLDLSRPFDLDSHYNDNACARSLIELASKEPEIRGVVMLEHGKVGTEYYRADLDPTSLSPIWSCTKAFTNLLLGMMIKEGVLSLDETLWDIFPSNLIWENVQDADDRKALPIKSIITMTAGLSLPDDWLADFILGAFQYGIFGGADFMDSLTYHKLNVSRTDTEFEYIYGGNILSYVIKERLQMTPEEFAKTRVFSLLGISDEDYIWQSNLDGMSFSWHGIFMTPRAMAKLGMLYLQRGHANSDNALVNEEFVIESARGTAINSSYGYGLWNIEEVYPERPTRYFAGGFGGNAIWVDENTGRVMSITSDNYYPPAMGGEIDDSSAALGRIAINCSSNGRQLVQSTATWQILLSWSATLFLLLRW